MTRPRAKKRLPRWRRPRLPVFVQDCTPYEVKSCADGRLVIFPTYPEGRSGVLSRMMLASQLGGYLNASYDARQKRGKP